MQTIRKTLKYEMVVNLTTGVISFLDDEGDIIKQTKMTEHEVLYMIGCSDPEFNQKIEEL